MMKQALIKTVLAGLLAAPLVASAAPVVIDFDDLANNTVLTNQYAGQGVTFSAFENSVAVGAVVGAFTNHSAPNVWSNCSPSICGARADELRINFASPVSSLQWYTDTAGSLQPFFEAYDAGDSLLETVFATATSQGTFALTSFASSNISYVRLFQPSDDWAYLVDTISFEKSQVPEPTSLALVGLALFGVAAARRRRGS